MAGRPGCSCLARRTSSLPSICGMRRSQRRRSSEPGSGLSRRRRVHPVRWRRDDAVAAGFQQEGADREDLFVVVDAEDRLLRPQCCLASAGGRRNSGLAADGPERHVRWLAGCRPGRSGAAPRSGRRRAPARSGAAAPRGKTDVKRQGSPVCSAKEQCHRSGELTLPDRGVRERPVPAQVATRAPYERRGSVCRGCGECERQENWPALDCVCRQRWCVGEHATAQQSSFSQLKLSVIQAKAIHLRLLSHELTELSSTLAKSTKVAPSLATAKLGRKERMIRRLHIHRYS